jgi:hypothetical protein
VIIFIQSIAIANNNETQTPFGASGTPLINASSAYKSDRISTLRKSTIATAITTSRTHPSVVSLDIRNKPIYELVNEIHKLSGSEVNVAPAILIMEYPIKSI